MESDMMDFTIPLIRMNLQNYHISTDDVVMNDFQVNIIPIDHNPDDEDDNLSIGTLTASERSEFVSPRSSNNINPMNSLNFTTSGDSISNPRMRMFAQRRRIGRNLEGAGFAYNPVIRYSDHPATSIGLMDNICKFCGAKRYPSETENWCCSKGRIKLESIIELPEGYMSLLSGDYPQSKSFIKNIRKYNNLFCMTSFKANITQFNDRCNNWPSTFRVQGQVSHWLGPLTPRPDSTPRYLQVYFTGDTSFQMDIRSNRYTGIDRDTINIIQSLLRDHNNLYLSSKNAMDTITYDNYNIIIRSNVRPQGEHERRFNEPTSDEVAVIFLESDVAMRDIVIKRYDDGSLTQIHEMHPLYDALQYPLIFWRGNETYHYNMKEFDPELGVHTNNKVTTTKYYRYHLMVRSDSQNYLLKCGQLYHQFIVDMWCKIESERLRFIRLNQNQLRASDYIHLRDAIAADLNPANIGQRIILPSTYIGSPRHMQQYSLDGMVYVSRFGTPDLFDSVSWMLSDLIEFRMLYLIVIMIVIYLIDIIVDII